MTRIFISYRRSDSEVVAGRIYDRLEPEFGELNVFKDVDNIPIGQDFRSAVQRAIQASRVMLVIIGKDWLNVRDSDGQRRLDDPADTVRFEIATALDRSDTVVIPVLVGGAAMPDADELPPDIRQLAFQNAAVVRNDPDFRRDITRLVEILREIDPVDKSKSDRPRTARSGRLIAGIAFAAALVLVIVGLLFATNAIRLTSVTPPTLDAVREAELLLTATRLAEVAALSSPTPNATELIGAVLTQFVVQTQAAENQQKTLTTEPQSTNIPVRTLSVQPTRNLSIQIAPTIVPVWTATSIFLSPQEDFAIANAQATLVARATVAIENRTLPIAVTLVIDDGDSMAVEDKMSRAVMALSQFIVDAPGDYIFSVVSYCDEIELMQAFTNDREQVISVLESLSAAGSTRLYDGAYGGVEQAASTEAQRRIVLLVSGGADTGSIYERNAAIDLALQENVEIYTIGFGSSIDETYLRELAETTGGELSSGDELELTTFFERMRN